MTPARTPPPDIAIDVEGLTKSFGGRVVVQRLPHAHEEAEVAAAESAVRARLAKAPVTGAVELFE
jgi:hypothetical protein